MDKNMDKNEEKKPKKKSEITEKKKVMDVESLTFKAYVARNDGESDEDATKRYVRVLADIRMYGHLCRRAAWVMTEAEIGCAQIEAEDGNIKITNMSEKVKQALALVTGTTGISYCYELRPWIKAQMPPEWKEQLVDNVLNTVSQTLRGGDAKIKKKNGDPMPRRVLVLQGRRQPPRFDHVGMHVNNKGANITPVKNGVILSWNNGLGPVLLKCRKRRCAGGSRLDPRASYVLHNLVEKNWEMGSVKINEKDGELRVSLSYYKPKMFFFGCDKCRHVFQRGVAVPCPECGHTGVTQMTLDPNRTVEAACIAGVDGRPYQFMHISLRDGLKGLIDLIWHEDMDAMAMVKGLDRFAATRAAIEEERKSCGRKRPWHPSEGNGSAARYNDSRGCACAKHREGFTKTWNHTNSAKLVKVCVRNRAGVLRVMDMPQKRLFGREWPWYAFTQMLAYKCKRAGINLILEAAPDLDMEEAADTVVREEDEVSTCH